MLPKMLEYEIRISETVDSAWLEWFDGLVILQTHESDGTTLRGSMPDQAALFGLLTRIRDLNLTLISVQRIE